MKDLNQELRNMTREVEMRTCTCCNEEKIRPANFSPNATICQECMRKKCAASRLKHYGRSLGGPNTLFFKAPKTGKYIGPPSRRYHAK